MPNLNWTELSHLQLGRYAEYYTKMEFASYGFEIYTSEVDDHGVDFVAKKKDGHFIEIQVKAVRKHNLVFMTKDKWDINNQNLWLALLLIDDGLLPAVYLIPATTWQNEDALICGRDYVGLKSKPEYSIRLSQKNMPLLMGYKLEEMLNKL